MRIRVQIAVRRPLKRKYQIQFGANYTYVSFKYEKPSLFCFFCCRLGHSDAFCETKIEVGMEVSNMGWNLLLKAQSRRALAMKSI